jgi:hypothetical protein
VAFCIGGFVVEADGAQTWCGEVVTLPRDPVRSGVESVPISFFFQVCGRGLLSGALRNSSAVILPLRPRRTGNPPSFKPLNLSSWHGCQAVKSAEAGCGPQA